MKKRYIVVGVAVVAVAASIGAAASKNSGNPGAPITAAPTAAGQAAPAGGQTTYAVTQKVVVLQESGNGIKTTKTFTTAADWSVKYSFDCSNFGTAGNFAVEEEGGQFPDPLVNSLEKSGHDTTYQHDDAGTHSLSVDSECDWTLTVTSGDKG